MGYAWNSLSERGGIILRQVALRVQAGYSHAEVAALLQDARNEGFPEIRELEDLRPPAVVSEGWVSSRLRELKKELETLKDA